MNNSNKTKSELKETNTLAAACDQDTEVEYDLERLATVTIESSRLSLVMN